MKTPLSSNSPNTKMYSLFLSAAFILTAVLSNDLCGQGTWSPVTGINAAGGTAMTLSDGSIMVKTAAGGGDGIGNIWDRITPNASGSYINGTWSSLPSMASTRLYISTQMLKDGRVYVTGGEYGTGYGNKAGDVYNPITNTWTQTPLPGGTVSDANSEILEDGRVVQALVCCGLKTNIFYNPSSNTYSPAPACIGIHNESAWLKLKDNSILMVDRNTTSTERYIPASNQWTVDASTPQALYDGFGLETGGAYLLPDGRSWWPGSTGRSAYYTPSGSTAPGTWSVGPVFPNNTGQCDAGGAIMCNGKILTAGSPTPTSGNVFKSPTYFYEFDYQTNTYTTLNLPVGNTYTNVPVYYFNFMNLPDGKVLVSRQDTNLYFIYTPTGGPQASWQPTVTAIVAQSGCNTFTMTGKLFNGISQGSSYGDDWQNNTNYPIVRLTQGSNVYYARTSNWNSIGVARGNLADTVKFTTQLTLPMGTYSLQVIANGIASQPVPFSPWPTLSSSLSPPSVCSGSPFTYTATSTNSAATFSWTRAAVTGISNTAVSTAQASNPNENLVNTTSNPVNVIYSFTTSAYACSTTQQVTVSVKPVPTVTLNGNSPICEGNNSVISASGASTYSWSNSATGPSITVSPTTTTTFSVTGTNTFGCDDSKQITVTVDPLPTIVLSAAQHSICTGESTTLSVSGGTANVWFDNSTASSVAVSPTVTTWFKVTVTNSFGCSNTDSTQVSVDPCTGIIEIGNDISKHVDIYPNPAHESVTVAFNARDAGKFSLKLYDLSGKLVKEENVLAVKGDNTYEMTLNGVAKGVYTIVLEKGSSYAKTKLSVK